LTLVYGAMVFAACMVFVTAGYLLVRHTLTKTSGEINETMLVDAGNLPPLKRDFWLGRLGQQQDLLDTALRQLLLSLLGVTGVVALLSLAAGWVLSGRVVRPLHRITATARRVAERSLGERIRLTGPHDELKELADTFDAMLERLDGAFDGQRRFVANASHELRTPLTATRTMIQVALGRPDASEDLRRLGVALLDINTQQRDLTEALLVLARNEQAPLDVESVPLTDLARRVMAECADAAASSGVELTGPTGSVTLDGDPLLLETLLRNLISNGIRYNRPGGWVRIAAGADGDDAWLTVSNTGDRALSPAETEAIFEPFRRLDAERTGSGTGTGLGLSIVRSVATAHGGRVAADAHEGGGLTVSVRLPRHAGVRAASSTVVPARATAPPASTSTVGKL
jgi:signal transduction histidine kinase